MKTFKIIFGAILALASLWAGSYLLEEIIPKGHWVIVPSFITSFAVFIVGVSLLIDGVL
jgi:hypothetical protein